MIDQCLTTNWTAVDRETNPAAAVGYLDAVGADDAVQAYKRHSFALLDLHPGDPVLDVGCGTGDDARALTRFVGPGGRVVGVDSSVAMVEEARRRSDGLGLPLELQVGDAHRLDFADESFAGARADRVLQHLSDPEQALAELVRVTKSGGRIAVAEPDWGTLVVDSPDHETTEAALSEVAAAVRNPWMGRQLVGLLRRAGVAEVNAAAFTVVVTDFARASSLLHLTGGVRRASSSGTVTAEAAERWVRDLEEAAAADRFCCALTVFVGAGRRP